MKSERAEGLTNLTNHKKGIEVTNKGKLKNCRLKLNDLIKKRLEVKGGRTTKTFSLSGREFMTTGEKEWEVQPKLGRENRRRKERGG